MGISRRISLPLLILSAAISIVWGSAIGLTHHTTTDFRAVYYGTRCLLQRHNPYNASELERAVSQEHGVRPSETLEQHLAITFYVNTPSTLILLVPFSLLPFWLAQVLWLGLLAGLLLLAGFLTWNLSESFAPGVSLLLTCLVLVNSLTIFSGGNTAGVAVPLCLVAVWCFLRARYVPFGILCMAVSLATKPHDSGLVWLFFLLVGGVYRKWALQSLIGTVTLVLSGVLWVSLVAPHWLQDWQANMTATSTHGQINDPGPSSIVGFHNLGPVIDLQSIVSVFRDNPFFYNSITYLVCGALLLAWAIFTLKSQFSRDRAWLAFAAIAPLSMLITYHHPWDAKLLLIAIPACAMLWAQGGAKRWLAFLVTAAALASTGDFPMAVGMMMAEKAHVALAGTYAQIATVLFARPIPVLLLVMAMFYLWIYAQMVIRDTSKGSEASLAQHCDPQVAHTLTGIK